MISIRMKSEIPKIRLTIEYILSDIEDILTAEECFDIRLVLDELLINSVLHGNDEDPNKFIYINVNVSQKNILVDIKDEGNGFSIENSKGEYDDIYSETGRGLQIVRGLCSSMEVVKNNIKCIYIRA